MFWYGKALVCHNYLCFNDMSREQRPNHSFDQKPTKYNEFSKTVRWLGEVDLGPIDTSLSHQSSLIRTIATPKLIPKTTVMSYKVN